MVQEGCGQRDCGGREKEAIPVNINKQAARDHRVAQTNLP
jgi:hypothetical protein